MTIYLALHPDAAPWYISVAVPGESSDWQHFA